MNTSLKGALNQSKKSYNVMEHNNKRIYKIMTLMQYENMLKHFIRKGYEGTADIPDSEIDEYINNLESPTNAKSLSIDMFGFTEIKKQ